MFFLFRGPQRRGTGSPAPPTCRGASRPHGPGKRGGRRLRPAPRLRGHGGPGTAGTPGRPSQGRVSPTERRGAGEEPGLQPPPAFGQVTGGRGEGRGMAGHWREGGGPECPHGEGWGTGEQLGGSPHLEQGGRAGNNPGDYVCARARRTPPPPALHIPRYSIKTSNPHAATAAITPPPGPGSPRRVGSPQDCASRPPGARHALRRGGSPQPWATAPRPLSGGSLRMGSRAPVPQSPAPVTPRKRRRRRSLHRCRIIRCCRGWWGRPASSCGKASPSPSWTESCGPKRSKS
ncbi:calcium-binding protein 2 isoform X2 [Aquila chrysaetos chrysaetos]|uniref:calcium-binding protein 2 isoform X2 n=1 Tax=Aquila chrysaetos chrysaetos TaxID=223781 RepID=UPI001B7D4010|nr:calcium-binding protein 2 isoform X2 [Aquila chrysaetos chrysaetos]